jgi:hypothetical protein
VTMVDRATRFVKQANDVTMDRAAVANRANVARVKPVKWMFVCVACERVAAVRMSIANMDDASARARYAISATTLVSRTRNVWMGNAFARSSVRKVSEDRWMDLDFGYCFSSSLLSVSMLERWTLYWLLSMFVSTRLARSPVRTTCDWQWDSFRHFLVILCGRVRLSMSEKVIRRQFY